MFLDVESYGHTMYHLVTAIVFMAFRQNYCLEWLWLQGDAKVADDVKTLGSS